MSECKCQHCGHRFSAEPEPQHKIRCGDSTDTEAMRSLVGEASFALCFTSPPYGNIRDYKIGDFDWLAMMNGVWDAVIACAKPQSHILVNLGQLHADRKVLFYWNPWLEHAEAGGWPLFGLYVWDKGVGAPGEWNGRLGPSHEFVFHFNLECGPANKWVQSKDPAAAADSANRKTFRQKDGTVAQATSQDKFGQEYKIPDSVIRVNRQMGRGQTGDHPAVFSVGFPVFGIKTWSQPGDLVVDPFMGSGTTMIAAHQTGRRSVGSELAPEYVDVCLLRFIKYADQQPTLASTGQTFEEVRRERLG